MTGLDARQRALLASLAMSARRRGLGWATAVARASQALQEAGVEPEHAFNASLTVHRGLLPRWVR